MDPALARAISQLQHGARGPVSAAGMDLERTSARRRIRNGALGLGVVALMFYFAFIALLIYRSHH
jgi:hypothetical protein